MTIYPGDKININITNFVLESDSLYRYELISSNINYEANYILTIETTNTFNSLKQCLIGSSLCNDGIFLIIHNIQIDSFYINVIGQTVNTNNISVVPSHGISVEVSLCQSGYGIKDIIVTNCEVCSYNSFTLKPNFSPCYECDDDINGMVCTGANNISISYNYWTCAVNVSNNNALYPLIDIEQQQNNVNRIFTSFCAPGFCCTKTEGCNYLLDSNFLCNFGRNVSSILCGKCNDDYSELFGSSNCGICDETNYLFLSLIFIFSVIPFILYISYFESAPKTTQTNNNM
eukprot:463839_1